jgi:predicted transcriptional regulator
MSYGRISKLLSELVGSGLLEELNGDKTSKYIITAKGMQFLVAYQSFEDFAQSFGLRL